MITQELKLHDQPEPVNYGSQAIADFDKKVIEKELEKAVAAGIVVGQRYRHNNGNSGYWIEVTGFDNDPQPTYYQSAPLVVLAKGNQKTSMEVGYSVKELANMILMGEANEIQTNCG